MKTFVAKASMHIDALIFPQPESHILIKLCRTVCLYEAFVHLPQKLVDVVTRAREVKNMYNSAMDCEKPA